ncbi:hypothetical protein FEE95_10895 [Maribacter algarum]|uniref:TonB-dependent receptor plug domain-containing protein n=1 Tax=Maribacter algarum (ex Zhang et al. 2020) TaxID=2578118 RepID=A0A5S3PQL1_9FLAO|nr:hypothetical protein [Maribacter algarum]TMM56992.1 hypothetical protein FEE95_10895 [Maribacter algarum]
MKKYFLFFLTSIICLAANAQDTDEGLKRISGIVFNNSVPLPNVTVKVVDGEEEVITDSKGRYDILTKVGDIISFDYPGMDQVKKEVRESTFTLNATLKMTVQELDNVTVTKEKKTKRTQEELFQDYETDPGIIKTSFGILDKETSGVAMQVVDGSQLSMASGDIVNAISNQFSGITVKGNDGFSGSTGAEIFMRGGGSIENATPAVFEVDGNLFTTPPLFLDIGSIKRIAKLSGLAATSRYGSVAQGGIFIINTISGTVTGKGGGKPVDRALAKNNDYKGGALNQAQIRKNWPEYLKTLYASKNFEEAKSNYESNAGKYANAAHYFVDAYAYFSTKWPGEKFQKTILEANKTKIENNPVWLKAFAYLLQSDSDSKGAVEMYKKVFLKRSNYAQSYRDLANSYVEANEIQKAANLYARYNKLLKDEFLQVEEEGAHPIIDREFNSFLVNNGSSFMSKADMNLAKSEVVDAGIRLVFEWNDEQANFELQFVNPEKKFFRWSPPYDEQMMSQNGEAPKSNIVEYFIDDTLPGDWQVNMKYRGNESGAPTYVKVTAYFNYGEKNERKKVEVFRLALKDVNQKLFELNGSNLAVYK